MTISKKNNYSQTDTNIEEMQLTLDACYIGKHDVTLTNYNTTSLPAVAAGSVIEVGGSLFEVTAEEAITGSPSDGTVYIMMVPSDSTLVPTFTNTAPTWFDSLQGFYDATGANRYLEFIMTKSDTSYSDKMSFLYLKSFLEMTIKTLTAISITSTSVSSETVLASEGLGLSSGATLRYNDIGMLGSDASDGILRCKIVSVTTEAEGESLRAGSAEHGISSAKTSNKIALCAPVIRTSGRVAFWVSVTYDDTYITVSDTESSNNYTFSVFVIYYV